MNWTAPPKPAELTEKRLIDAILNGRFPINSHLPGERELAAQLGVTRPTLREALQRLARDGWLEIRHGRPTRVRNYWEEGNLGVLGALSTRPQKLSPEFIPQLLEVRKLLAPTYTRLAVANNPEKITSLLPEYQDLEDEACVFAVADFELHRQLTIASGNPIFTLILNGFKDLYHNMARIYFAQAEARASSRRYYRTLAAAVQERDLDRVETLTREVMEASLAIWRSLQKGGQKDA